MSEVTVTIFDRDYRLAVSSGEEDLIRECAKAVDDQMQELRASGHIFGNDQIAVLAALQLAYEARKADNAAMEEVPAANNKQPTPSATTGASAQNATPAIADAADLAEVRALCRLCEDALLKNAQIGAKMGTLF